MVDVMEPAILIRDGRENKSLEELSSLVSELSENDKGEVLEITNSFSQVLSKEFPMILEVSSEVLHDKNNPLVQKLMQRFGGMPIEAQDLYRNNEDFFNHLFDEKYQAESGIIIPDPIHPDKDQKKKNFFTWVEQILHEEVFKIIPEAQKNIDPSTFPKEELELRQLIGNLIVESHLLKALAKSTQLSEAMERHDFEKGAFFIPGGFMHDLKKLIEMIESHRNKE